MTFPQTVAKAGGATTGDCSFGIATDAPASQAAGHAVARLAPGDFARLGARPGDIVKITGRTVAVARAELAEQGPEGLI